MRRRGAKFEKRLSKGEFVRRDIAAEQNQCAPIIFNGGLNFDKLHHLEARWLPIAAILNGNVSGPLPSPSLAFNRQNDSIFWHSMNAAIKLALDASIVESSHRRGGQK